MKELHIVQSRHIVLCKKKRFSYICIYRCTFSYNHTLLAHDMLRMGRGGHSTKVQNFFCFFPTQFTGFKFRRCFKRVLDRFVACCQNLSICFWRQLNIGGIFSWDRPPWVKRIYIVVLILIVLSVGLSE